MNVLVITGTGTGVGKTVVTAALAALARGCGERVAVVKPVQTGAGPGDPGDLDVIGRLSGVGDLHEYARFRAALSPAAAARRAAVPPADLSTSCERVQALARERDLVLIEGAGGLLVRYDEAGATIAGVAAVLAAPVLVVTTAGLGTLNATELTLEALAHRDLTLADLVIGSWPDEPGPTERSNLQDLETISGRPLGGAMPDGAGSLGPVEFMRAAQALQPATELVARARRSGA